LSFVWLVGSPSAIIRLGPEPREVVKMCHDGWMRRERRRREERFDEELRYLFDQRERSELPAPLVECERDEQPTDPERLRVEAGGRA
jgi:hypothetical protein